MYSVSAVSYTHLDVYKRQVQCNASVRSAHCKMAKDFAMARIMQVGLIDIVSLRHLNYLKTNKICMLYTVRLSCFDK